MTAAAPAENPAGCAAARNWKKVPRSRLHYRRKLSIGPANPDAQNANLPLGTKTCEDDAPEDEPAIGHLDSRTLFRRIGRRRSAFAGNPGKGSRDPCLRAAERAAGRRTSIGRRARAGRREKLCRNAHSISDEARAGRYGCVESWAKASSVPFQGNSSGWMRWASSSVPSITRGPGRAK